MAALYFDNPDPSPSDLGLNKYEILPVEPLHAVAGHIKNLYDEVPKHLTKVERGLFERALQASLVDKHVKRCVDYRKSLIEVTTFVHTRINTRIFRVFETLCEIQEIFYSRERTPSTILRLYNVTFLHALLLVECFNKTKSLTQRKFFGQYYHSIICHAAQQYRIMPLPSSNAESEERMFKTLKEISAKMTNHKPDNVILTCFVRVQARDELKANHWLSKRKRNLLD